MNRNGVWLGFILLLGAYSGVITAESEPMKLAVAQNGVLVPGQRSETGSLIRAVATDLRERLSNPASTRLQAAAITLHSPRLLLQFYQQRDYQSAWLDERGQLGPLAEQLLMAIDNARDDGLRSSDYHSVELQQLLRSLRIAYAPTVRQLADIDLLLSDAFLTYAQHLLVGRLDPRQIHGEWMLQPRSKNLAAILTEALEQRDVHATLARLLSPYPGYTSLRQALAEYRQLAEQGGWRTVPVGERLEVGSRNNRVRLLRERLKASGDLLTAELTAEQTQTANTDGSLFDAKLAQAVRNFQARHGLAVDGVVGPQTLSALNVSIFNRIEQMELNLERLRWLPADLGRRYILVNIPSQQLWVIEDGQTVISSRVVVGQTSRETPVFTENMSYLVFSPFWHIPRSIAVRDKLPLLQRNPYALQSDRIRIFSQGQEIEPGSVDWASVTARNFNFTLRQDPGSHNALGGVKFMFPNPYNVYIHDTPSRSLFERPQRAFSSGCVRTDAPLELAQYLLNDQPNWSVERISTAMQQSRERRVNLTETIPVHLLYWTAWVDDEGKVQFRDDIYHRDVVLTQALYRS